MISMKDILRFASLRGSPAGGKLRGADRTTADVAGRGRPRPIIRSRSSRAIAAIKLSFSATMRVCCPTTRAKLDGLRRRLSSRTATARSASPCRQGPMRRAAITLFRRTSRPMSACRARASSSARMNVDRPDSRVEIGYISYRGAHRSLRRLVGERRRHLRQSRRCRISAAPCSTISPRMVADPRDLDAAARHGAAGRRRGACTVIGKYEQGQTDQPQQDAGSVRPPCRDSRTSNRVRRGHGEGRAGYRARARIVRRGSRMSGRCRASRSMPSANFPIRARRCSAPAPTAACPKRT